MALKAEVYAGRFDVNCPAAYIKVESTVFTKNHMVVTVSVFASEEARLAGARPVGDQSYQFDREDATADPIQPLKEAYNLIKARPEFANAVDA